MNNRTISQSTSRKDNQHFLPAMLTWRLCAAVHTGCESCLKLIYSRRRSWDSTACLLPLSSAPRRCTVATRTAGAAPVAGETDRTGVTCVCVCREGGWGVHNGCKRKRWPSKASLKRCHVYSVDQVSSVCLLAVNGSHSGSPIIYAARLQTSEWLIYWTNSKKSIQCHIKRTLMRAITHTSQLNELPPRGMEERLIYQIISFVYFTTLAVGWITAHSCIFILEIWSRSEEN